MERLAGKMTAHTSQVRDLVSIPELAQEEVALRVTVGQAATPSLDANIFTGILEGVTGRLGLSPPGMTDPPVLAREGVSQQWAATLQEAVHKTEGRAFHVGLIDHDILPPGLQLDCDPSLDAGGPRCDGTGPHACLIIWPRRQHSGARKARNVPTVGLL